MRLVWATVRAIAADETDVQRLEVDVDGGGAAGAINYPALSGRCRAEDRVLLNTTAVELSLGTGGAHFVVARLDSAEGVTLDVPSPGHVMKLRYTPLQVDVLSVESPESPHHTTMASAHSLEGMPVVCCGLHSQVPLVAAAVKAQRPSARIAYCMTDEAALPMALSNLMRSSRQAGLLDVTVSCGQAFGGEFESVNLHSGLLAAKHVAETDVAIVAIGPGVVGTATPLGHGGVAQGEAINAVASVGGRPVACLRISEADARDRHRGVSHHSLAALSTIALSPATVALPTLEPEFFDAIHAQLDAAGVWERHVEARSDEGSKPPPSLRGVVVSTMGRGGEADPAFFSACFAAGDIASGMLAPLLE